MAKFRDVLKERNFFYLWLAQIVSQFGDRLNHMALIGLVYKRAPGSTIQLAKLLAFTIIPLILLGPIAGALVDRMDRKRTMITCDVLRGLLVVSIPLFLIYAKAILPVYFVVFSVFAIGCLFIPARLSIIPDLVKKENLLLANSLSTTTGVVAAFVGFAIGGIVVEIVGARGAFFIDATSYFVSAIMITMIAPRRKIVVPREAKVKSPISHDIKEGILYLKNHPDAWFVANVLILLMAAAGCVYAVGIVFIQESLHSVTRDLSILGIFLGIGFFASSIIYGRFGQNIKRAHVISAGLCGSGILICAFALIVRFWNNYAAVCSAIGLLGFAVAPVIISSNTLIYEVTKDDLRGRVFTSLGALMSATLLVFMFTSSNIAERFGRFQVLIGTGVLTATFGTWATLRWLGRKNKSED